MHNFPHGLDICSTLMPVAPLCGGAGRSEPLGAEAVISVTGKRMDEEVPPIIYLGLESNFVIIVYRA